MKTKHTTHSEQELENWEKECWCHCHSEKYKNAAEDVKMKPVGCEHCKEGEV